MGYTTTQYHNQKERFIFDIRSLTISIWKSPRQWLKFNFYNWLHWQIGAIEIMWHRLPSRRRTPRAADICLACGGKRVIYLLSGHPLKCFICGGSGKRR